MFRPSLCIRTFSRGSRNRLRVRTACRRRVRAYVPQPVVGKSAAELRAYIDGEDPVSGRPFAQELIDGLTIPLDEKDVTGLSFERSTPRLLEPDTEDRLQRLFAGNGWTDHQPIVLPTEERVAAMLAGTSHAPHETVGRLLADRCIVSFGNLPSRRSRSMRVMAGARPGVPSRDTRDGRERGVGPLEFRRPRKRPLRSSTVRSATRSE